ncbi:MAG: hypothetical protein OT477_20575, partial [Chloroflexi bacterium]|nr:hypothetical protein [Chloroflexota bacterium]
ANRMKSVIALAFERLLKFLNLMQLLAIEFCQSIRSKGYWYSKPVANDEWRMTKIDNPHLTTDNQLIRQVTNRATPSNE